MLVAAAVVMMLVMLMVRGSDHNLFLMGGPDVFSDAMMVTVKSQLCQILNPRSATPKR